MPVSDAVLTQILQQLEALQVSQQALQAKLDNLGATPLEPTSPKPLTTTALPTSPSSTPAPAALSTSPPSSTPVPARVALASLTDKEREKLLYPGRVNLTTYPDQHGIAPVPLTWGAASAADRGPVVCSRLPGSIKARNALGAHAGSYSIYRALSIAMGALDPTHKPDYSQTEPPVDIPPQPSWSNPSKIVSFDPWGHLVPQVFKEAMDGGVDVRPSIAVTKAHLKMSELDDAERRGELVVDGSIVLRSPVPRKVDGTADLEAHRGVEVNVSKAAIDPVWYLPGVADRFGISESLLRRALFEDTGGMYPELITRPDIKVFLPPIGGITIYIFGPPAYLSDPSKELTVRVHDECNGSDVFGSDICTCKPYLTYAIEECIRGAQGGGVGLVAYFRKEGRALGEVTKYLVYNLRKRGGDSADKYFKSTELIAGVKDMRFQALMPDVLHWLGIQKIDKMVSMSDMKYDAIVNSGIPIHTRYDIPEHLIPPDSRVEIDAKIAAGYFSSGKQVTEADLVKTVGRTWEETEH
ncbi:cyclohydrolase [Ephemerocybe angulata]|uniref:Cyclohydrolase n=1 Tax=Ephemerocybe angulata TaxID=980116 RepID=A0A8H6M7J6_9AGAR|nr:cyclohydrolase [Tulosesus angulatus]